MKILAILDKEAHGRRAGIQPLAGTRGGSLYPRCSARWGVLETMRNALKLFQ